MDAQGKVSEWNDERGFGYLQSQAGGPRLFFHIRDYQQQGRRPETGEWVRYVAGTGRDGKPSATRVRRVVPPSASAKATRTARHATPRRWEGGWPAWAMLLGYAGAVAWAIKVGRLPDGFAIGVLGISTVTWATYFMDKRAAGRGERRTPEDVLHLLELLGGWPGALMAQRGLHHKNRKRRYQYVFWGMVVLHSLAVSTWVWWASAR